MSDDARRDTGAPLGRRAFLAASLAGWAGASARAEGPKGRKPPTEGDELRAAADALRRAEVPEVRWGRSEHYQAIGNAPDDFRDAALGVCEGLREHYLKHFRGLGFEVQPPPGRLTLATLADFRTFRRVAVNAPPGNVAGIYEESANRVTIYDQRAPDAPAKEAGFENHVHLKHEAAHQLTYNTGLLRRGGDVAACISEGLAMYCEVVTAAGSGVPGRVNHVRLDSLVGAGWLTPAQLLAGDDWMKQSGDSRRILHSYAHCWLLVHYLLVDPAMRPRFRDYLSAIALRRRTADGPDPAVRLADARDHLGDLDQLALGVRRHASRALRGSLPGSSRLGPSMRRR
jgi:hypothetical protein